MTTSERVSFAPNVPTFAETPGLEGFEVSHWMGVFAPAGTPPRVIARLQSEIAAVLREPQTAERLRSIGVERVGNTPDAKKYLAAERDKFARIFRQANLVPE